MLIDEKGKGHTTRSDSEVRHMLDVHQILLNKNYCVSLLLIITNDEEGEKIVLLRLRSFG